MSFRIDAINIRENASIRLLAYSVRLIFGIHSSIIGSLQEEDNILEYIAIE